MLDAENAPVKLTIFHDYWIAIHVFGVHSVRPTGGMHKGVSAEHFETPFVGEPPAFGGVGGTRPPRLSPGGGNGKGGDQTSLLPQAITRGIRQRGRPAGQAPQALIATQKPEFP